MNSIRENCLLSAKGKKEGYKRFVVCRKKNGSIYSMSETDMLCISLILGFRDNNFFNENSICLSSDNFAILAEQINMGGGNNEIKSNETFSKPFKIKLFELEQKLRSLSELFLEVYEIGDKENDKCHLITQFFLLDKLEGNIDKKAFSNEPLYKLRFSKQAFKCLLHFLLVAFYNLRSYEFDTGVFKQLTDIQRMRIEGQYVDESCNVSVTIKDILALRPTNSYISRQKSLGRIILAKPGKTSIDVIFSPLTEEEFQKFNCFAPMFNLPWIISVSKSLWFEK